MHVGFACANRDIATRTRMHIPWQHQVSILSRHTDIVTKCRELRLQVLFLDLGPAWRQDAQLWRDLFADNLTDVIVLAQQPATVQVMRALRAGVYEVIDMNCAFFSHTVTKALLNSMMERQPKHDRELHIREFGEASVAIRSRRVLLTRTEYQVLSILAHAGGRYVSSQAIMEKIWGSTAANHKEDLYVYISRLREKLEKKPGKPEMILSSRGMGYAFMGEISSRNLLL